MMRSALREVIPGKLSMSSLEALFRSIDFLLVSPSLIPSATALVSCLTVLGGLGCLLANLIGTLVRSTGRQHGDYATGRARKDESETHVIAMPSTLGRLACGDALQVFQRTPAAKVLKPCLRCSASLG